MPNEAKKSSELRPSEEFFRGGVNPPERGAGAVKPPERGAAGAVGAFLLVNFMPPPEGKPDDTGADATPPKPPDAGAGVGLKEEEEDDTDPIPPPPNFAAMRAFASSRSLVCLMTYCSSVSPVNRSTPFLSSPGKPGASPRAADPPEVGAAAGILGVEVG